MDISYEYDVQDVLINSRKARPEPEPNWRSLYEEERERVHLLTKEITLLRNELDLAQQEIMRLEDQLLELGERD